MSRGWWLPGKRCLPSCINQVDVWWSGIMVWGCIEGVVLGTWFRNFKCIRILRHSRQCYAPSLEWHLPTPKSEVRSEVHKSMDEQVWWRGAWLTSTQLCPQWDQTLLGWIRVEPESQAFFSNISVCSQSILRKKWLKSSNSAQAVEHRQTPHLTLRRMGFHKIYAIYIVNYTSLLHS